MQGSSSEEVVAAFMLILRLSPFPSTKGLLDSEMEAVRWAQHKMKLDEFTSSLHEFSCGSYF